MKNLALLSILLLFALVGPTQAQTRVESPEYGFAITLPEGWSREPLRSDFSDTYLRVASPIGIEDAALYVQIFNQGRFTPESYRESVIGYITTRMEGEVLSRTELPIGDKKGWQIEYEGVSVGYVGERRHFLNTVVFHQGKIFVVHCAARSAAWTDYESDFRQSSASFSVGEL